MEPQVSSDGHRLTCLQDGATVFGADVFPGLPPRPADDYATHFNAFLLESPGVGPVLVDCGAGALFGDIAGRLPLALAARGIAPEDVTHLVFTHLHTDHCGGALGADGAPAYPNARIVLHADELAHWRDRDHFAARVIAAHADRLRPVAGEAALFPGVTAWPLPGHTPGHMGLRIGAGLAVVGDVVHAERLQLPDPDLATRYDHDPAQARASRHRALAAAVAEGRIIAGGHLLGGFAQLAVQGGGYRRVAP